MPGWLLSGLVDGVALLIVAALVAEVVATRPTIAGGRALMGDPRVPIWLLVVLSIFGVGALIESARIVSLSAGWVSDALLNLGFLLIGIVIATWVVDAILKRHERAKRTVMRDVVINQAGQLAKALLDSMGFIFGVTIPYLRHLEAYEANRSDESVSFEERSEQITREFDADLIATLRALNDVAPWQIERMMAKLETTNEDIFRIVLFAHEDLDAIVTESLFMLQDSIRNLINFAELTEPLLPPPPPSELNPPSLASSVPYSAAFMNAVPTGLARIAADAIKVRDAAPVNVTLLLRRYGGSFIDGDQDAANL